VARRCSMTVANSARCSASPTSAFAWEDE
jgi:hypothetical protein